MLNGFKQFILRGNVVDMAVTAGTSSSPESRPQRKVSGK
jgi:hypothetical protein